MVDLGSVSDMTLVAMLLSHNYRVLDAGGLSCRRSQQSYLTEPALLLMDQFRPKEDIADWPPTEAIVREAERRNHARLDREQRAWIEAVDAKIAAENGGAFDAT